MMKVGGQGWSLRRYLAVLVLAVFLPAGLFGLTVSWFVATNLRDDIEASAARVSESIAHDVTEHLSMMTAAMRAMARSPSITQGDYQTAYRHVLALSQDLGQHVGLATAHGEQIFNSRRPFGEALPRRADDRSYRRALETGKPSVSDVVIGAIAKRPLITVDVPAVGANGPLVLGTSTDVARMAEVVAGTKVAEGWITAVLDSDGRYITRSLSLDKMAGQLAKPELVAAAKSDQMSGTFSLVTVEGIPVAGFYHKIAGTGWTAAVGVPIQMLQEPLHRQYAWLAGGGLAALLLTVVIGLRLGHVINRETTNLAAAAEALGAGLAVEIPPASLREFEIVGGAVEKASADLAEREARRAAADADLIKAKAAAESATLAKSKFLAAASHDLRQPFQAMRLFFEVLQPQLSPKQAEVAVRLDEAMRSGEQLLSALLDVSTLDAGTVKVMRRRFPLSEVIAKLAAECGPQARDAGLALRWVSSDLLVDSDPVLLTRMIRNLLHNAIRYTPGGRVLLGCRRRGGSVVVEVWDTGRGIPEDQHRLIFEDFYQVDNEARNQSKGLGLGLSVVARMGRLLGHPVAVRSWPGKGSCFSITLAVAGHAHLARQPVLVD